MSKAGSEEGHWTIPGTGAAGVFGILKFDPKNGLRLRLPDCPRDHPLGRPLRRLGEATSMPAIEGTSGLSARWLLENAFLTKASHALGRNGSMELFANRGFRVGSAPKCQPDAILAVHVRPDILGNFPHAFGYKWEWDNSGFAIEKPMRFLPHPSLVSHSAEEGARLALFTHGSSKINIKSGVSHRTYQFLTLTFDKPRSLQDVSRYSSSLRNFISLLAGGSIRIRDTSFVAEYHQPECESSLIRAGEALAIPIGDRKRRTLPESPTNSEWISSEFQTIADRWLSLNVRAGTLVTHFFSIYHNPAPFVDDRFLTLAHLLEAWHRQNFDGTFMPDDEFQRFRTELVRAIPSSAPSAWQEAVSRRLEFSNERSLRVRLRDLLRSIPMDARSFITTSHPDEWAAAIASTRNGMVHMTGPTMNSSKSGHSLFNLSSEMNLLFLGLLLTKLSIPTPHLATYLQVVRRWTILPCD